MKKKVKDFTVGDMVRICKKARYCEDCIFSGICVNLPENAKKEDLEKEVIV